MVVQIGSTNLETLGFTPKLSSAEAMVTGKVPADDLEKKATAIAGSIPLAIFRGFNPRTNKIIGRIINI